MFPTPVYEIGQAVRWIGPFGGYDMKATIINRHLQIGGMVYTVRTDSGTEITDVHVGDLVEEREQAPTLPDDVMAYPLGGRSRPDVLFVDPDFDPEQLRRAAALDLARRILGDVTPGELAKAARYIVGPKQKSDVELMLAQIVREQSDTVEELRDALDQMTAERNRLTDVLFPPSGFDAAAAADVDPDQGDAPESLSALERDMLGGPVKVGDRVMVLTDLSAQLGTSQIVGRQGTLEHIVTEDVLEVNGVKAPWVVQIDGNLRNAVDVELVKAAS